MHEIFQSSMSEQQRRRLRFVGLAVVLPSSSETQRSNGQQRRDEIVEHVVVAVADTAEVVVVGHFVAIVWP